MAQTLMVDVDIWLHDFLQNRSVQIQQVKDYKIERFLQGSEKLSFRLPLNDSKLAFLHEDQLVFAEGDYWYVDRIEDTHPGDKEIICNARHIAELTWRIRFGNFSVLGKTPSEGLTLILTGSDWTVGTVPGSSLLYTMEDIDASTLTLLRKWAAITGYELDFDTVARTVSLVTATGTFKPIGFRWGKSIREVKRDYYPPQATRLYPLGANNLTINGPNPTGLPYIEDYSFYEGQGLTTIQARALYRKDLSWVDERYLLAVNLYDAAQARLAKLSQPRVFYSAKVLDLSKLMNGNPGYEVGDTTIVDDEILGVLENVRVTRTVRFPRDPKKDEVELGFMSNGLLDVSEGANRSIDYSQLFTIVDTNPDPLTIGGSTINYNTIALTSAGSATFVSGSTFVGVATGTGTVSFRMVVDGVVVGREYSINFTNGQVVEFSWPSFATDIPEGAHVVDWRAQVTSGSGTIALLAEHGRSWVLSSGAVGVGVNSSPNAFIVETLDVFSIEMFNEFEMELLMVPIFNQVVEETLDVHVVPITGSLVLPFQLEDPVFGELDSQYALSGPSTPAEIGIYPYVLPPGGSADSNVNFGPGTVFTGDPIREIGPALYLRSDKGVIHSGGAVNVWKDRSGNAFHAVSLSGRTPSTNLFTIGGKNALRFDAGDVMRIPDALLSLLDTAGAAELFYVMKGDTNNASQGAPFQGFAGHSSHQHQNFSDGKWYNGFGSTTRKDTGDPTRDTTLASLYNVRTAAGAWSAYIQNVLHYSTATNVVDFTGGPTDSGATPGGWLGGNAGSGTYWAGLLAEWIIFPFILSGPQRSTVVSELNSKYTLGI